ncbi:MAG TPA: hypothetical protein VF116_09105 [Ktedonobacterales bacterium]
MRPKPGDKSASHYAYTDLYDEIRHNFLIQYPPALVIGLGIAGVVAFMLVGFLGYRDPLEGSFTYTVFHQPWPLYLWFCALIIALQASVLRHRTLRRQMVMALTATIISMIIVGIIYFYNYDIGKFLQQVLNLIHLNLPQLGNNPWTYTIINFGVIIIFWLSTVRRWIRRAMGLPLHAGAYIGLEEDDDAENPDLRQLISGDLIAGAILTLLLSLIFTEGVINLFSGLLQTGVAVKPYALSLPGSCASTAGSCAPHSTLSFIDQIQTLIYLPLGLLILALGAVVSGLGKEVDADDPTSIFQRVIDELIDTIRAALNRRTGVAFNLALGLRTVAWPALVFLGVVGVAAASRGIQTYLHLQSDSITCRVNGHWSADLCGGGATLHAVQTQLNSLQQYQAAGLAIIAGVGAVLAIVFSLALLLFKWRVAENTLRFLGLVGFIVLLTFWIFSLALSGFNGLFSLTGLSSRVPFPQPGVTTIISAAALIIYGIYLLFRRARGKPASQSAPVAAGAPTGRQSGGS